MSQVAYMYAFSRYLMESIKIVLRPNDHHIAWLIVGSRIPVGQLCINLVIIRDGAKGCPSLYLIKLTCFSIDYFVRAQDSA